MNKTVDELNFNNEHIFTDKPIDKPILITPPLSTSR